MRGPQALIFDVFGTIVDWRSGLLTVARSVGATAGVDADWSRVVDRWRMAYQPALDRIRKGLRPWTSLDEVNRETLDDTLDALGVSGLSERTRQTLVTAWHRLDPWPDSVPGLARLRMGCRTATLSNADVALLTDLVQHGSLPFDLLLSAEHAQTYKPSPAVYATAVDRLGVPCERVMMVAAHADDLKAAASCGLMTAFLRRPLEWGPGKNGEHPPACVDVVATDMVDLAEQILGASDIHEGGD